MNYITMTGFDVRSPKFNSLKYVRQLRAVVKWMKTKGRGTIEAATGVGKTLMALIILVKFFKKDVTKLRYGGKVLIVVPTLVLKTQWEGLLSNLNLLTKVEVQVINTVALSKGYARYVDLLIIDEVHLMAADQFRNVFDRVSYTWILGLTATLDRLDKKDYIVKQAAPICDSITQKEAVENGWISDFIEFNLAVPVTRAEKEQQVALGKTIRYYMSKFGDFDKMLACLQKGHATSYALYLKEEPQTVIAWAVKGTRAIRERRDFLETTQHKIDAAIELIQEFNVRTITFSQTTSFADEIAKQLGNKCRVYHSNVKSELQDVTKTKVFKTIKSTLTFTMKLKRNGIESNYKKTRNRNEFTVTWIDKKNISGSKVAEANRIAFENNEFDILASAKALDQGFDVPDVILGVDSSRSENPTQHVQRVGRIARTHKLPDGSEATKIYVNLYIPDWSVPDSRDEKKLRNCQSKNSEHVVWVDDLDELKRMLHLILKKRGGNKSSINSTN